MEPLCRATTRNRLKRPMCCPSRTNRHRELKSPDLTGTLATSDDYLRTLLDAGTPAVKEVDSF
jgi:hypothetical protein